MFFCVFILLGCTKQPLLEGKSIKRVALVMGNQNYFKNELDNPINDAKGVAKTLEGIGFDVILEFDLTLKKLNEVLATLKSKIEVDNTMVFIYFAGHGNTLQKNSAEEYLMMTDKNKKVLVSLYKFYDFLKEAKTRYNIITIDACRDYQEHYIALNQEENENALANFRGNFKLRSIRHGKDIKEDEFVVLDNNYSYELPPSTIVSYATRHHQKAKDWSIYDKHHSPYSYALMKYLDDEEIPINEVFRRVRVSLLKETEREQNNLEELNLEKNIWLVPKKVNIAFAPPI